MSSSGERPGPQRLLSPVGSAILVVLALSACARSESEARSEGEARRVDGRARAPSSVLLITLDTTRADHLGPWGGRAPTPVLDGLASESVVFETAVSASPLTAPSHASMLTGRFPPGHGVRDNGLFALSPSVPFLPELARAAGFATAGFVAAPVVGSAIGFDRGFELFREPPQDELAPPGMPPELDAEEQVDRFLAWLPTADPDRPFFVWLHLFDPHFPYEAPPELAERLPDRPYAAEIAFADAQLGRALAAIRAAGRDPTTTIVVTADHGEGLGDHGERTHGLFLYESTLRVPLLLRPAAASPWGEHRGETVTSLARTVDLFPTLAREMGLQVDPGIDGHDLLESVSGSSSPEPAYAETLAPRHRHGWSPLYSARDGRYKATVGRYGEVFDLLEDPGEESPLAGGSVGGEGRALEAWIRRIRDTQGPVVPTPSGADRRLEALGYLGGTPPQAPASSGEEPDPRARRELLPLFAEALGHHMEGRPEQALAAARTILEQDPGDPEAVRIEEAALGRLGRWRDLEALLRSRYGDRPTDSRIVIELATTLRRQGRPEEALDVLAGRREAEASLLRGELLLASGRSEEAAALARSLLDGTHERAAARRLLAATELARGHPDRAASALRSLLEEAPDDYLARRLLAFLLLGQKRYDEAEAEIARLEATGYPDPELELARGELLLSRGAVDAAVAAFESGWSEDPGWAELALGSVVEEPVTRSRLARRLQTMGRAELAESVLMKGAERGRLDGTGYYLASQLRFLAGDLAAGEALCRAGLEREPGHPWLLYNLARLAAMKGDTERAAGLLAQALPAGGEDLRRMAAGDPVLAPILARVPR